MLTQNMVSANHYVSANAGMAALSSAGDIAAAEAAALGFFLLGTLRCILLQIPPFKALLISVCHGLQPQPPTSRPAEI